MSSYITDSDKDSLACEFFNLHDTFARPIVIWKTAKQIVLSTSATNNYIFESAPFNDVTEIVQVSGVFNARIKYPPKEQTVQFSTNASRGATDQINIQRDDGTVRITVDATGMAYLLDAKRVTFDDDIFDISISKRPHSLIGAPKFYDFILSKTN